MISRPLRYKTPASHDQFASFGSASATPVLHSNLSSPCLPLCSLLLLPAREPLRIMESPPSTSRRGALLLAAQLLLWWLANNLYAIDAQGLLTGPEVDPFLFIDLTFAHVFVGLCMGFLFRTYFSPRQNPQPASAPQQWTLMALTVAVLHLLGTVLTNASYRSIGATGTLVWKLTEPLAMIVLKFLVLGERTSLLAFLGIDIVLLGVLLFSANSLTLVAVSPILLANLAFPTRNVLLKKMQQGRGERLAPAQRLLGLYVPALPLAAFTLVVKIVLFGGSSASLIPQLLKNAAIFNTYQLASLLVLERLDALTHSLANTMKRFTGIVLAAVYFAEPLGVQHGIGLLCTFLGFPMYVFGSIGSKDTSARKKMVVGKFVLLFVAFCSLIGMLAFYGSLTKGAVVTVERSVKSVPSPVRDIPPLSSKESVKSVPSPVTDILPPSSKESSADTLAPDLMVIVEVRYEELPTEQVLSYAEAKSFDDGDNTGNFVWQYSAYWKLPDFSRTTTCNTTRLLCFNQHVAEGSNSMVSYRPGANFFNPRNVVRFKYDLEGLRRFKTTPLLIGVGVQAYFTKNSTKIDLDPGREIETQPEDFEFLDNAKELLNELQERKAPMLFRGDFTLKAAQNAGYMYGISNGCPSLFMNEDVWLGETLQRRYEEIGKRVGDKSLKIAINIKEGTRFRSWYKAILSSYPNSFVYSQGKGDMISLQKAKVPFERVRMFNNVQNWRESMKGMDLSIGARIHGNMLALGVGVPVFVLAPDHRVLELVSRMKIPHTTFYSEELRVDEFDVAQIVSEAGFDGWEFDLNRCGIAKNYRKVFAMYGIQVARHVKEISDLC